MTLLVTGAGGQLGGHLAKLPGVVGLSREELDVVDAAAVAAALDTHRPRAVVHCGARTRVDACEATPADTYAVNAGGTAHVARACAQRGIRLLHISTDYVLTGPDVEGHRLPVNAPLDPRSVYARSKAAAEAEVHAHGGCVVRVQWLWSLPPTGFVAMALHKLRSGERPTLVTDQRGAPTPARQLAQWLVTLSRAPQLPAVVHLATQGDASPVEWIGALAHALGLPLQYAPTTRAALSPVFRPARSCLDVSETAALLGHPLPSWKEALHAEVAHLSHALG